MAHSRDSSGLPPGDRLVRRGSTPNRSSPASPSARLYGRSRPDFFKPCHVGGQFADLGVEFFALFVVGVFFGLGFVIPLKEGDETLDGAGLPGTEHIGMDLQVGSNLVERPLLEGFEDGFGFEIE